MLEYNQKVNMNNTTCSSMISEMPKPPKVFNTQKTVITLTNSAEKRIKELISQRQESTLGIRIGVKSSGCTGLAYTFEYVNFEKLGDEKIEQNGVKIYIDSKALLYIIGTTLDFVERDLESGFVFINPNAKAQCGCGESFSV